MPVLKMQLLNNTCLEKVISLKANRALETHMVYIMPIRKGVGTCPCHLAVTTLTPQRLFKHKAFLN